MPTAAGTATGTVKPNAPLPCYTCSDLAAAILEAKTKLAACQETGEQSCTKPQQDDAQAAVEAADSELAEALAAAKKGVRVDDDESGGSDVDDGAGVDKLETAVGQAKKAYQACKGSAREDCSALQATVEKAKRKLAAKQAEVQEAKGTKGTDAGGGDASAETATVVAVVAAVLVFALIGGFIWWKREQESGVKSGFVPPTFSNPAYGDANPQGQINATYQDMPGYSYNEGAYQDVPGAAPPGMNGHATLQNATYQDLSPQMLSPGNQGGYMDVSPTPDVLGGFGTDTGESDAAGKDDWSEI